MKRAALALALLLASAPSAPASADGTLPATPGELVDALYAPYTGVGDTGAADWERIPASAELEALIALWLGGIEGPIDDLSSFGWLCQCQDWDLENFAYRVVARIDYRMTVEVAPGWGVLQRNELVIARRDGFWVLDDLFNESFPKGLKQALREAIALQQAELE